MASNFYHKYRARIADVKTSDGGNQILSALYIDFKRYSRVCPWEDEEIAKTYQLLKKNALKQCANVVKRKGNIR